MKYLKILKCLILIIILLTGCWDSRQLRDITVIKSAAIDMIEDAEEETIELTLSSPIPEKYRTTERVQVTTGRGHSTRNAKINMESEKSEKIDMSKLRALMISDNIARENIYPTLDVIYRDPRSPLAARLIIAEGKARDIVELSPEDKPRTSELVAELIDAAEIQSMLPKTNIQLICPLLFDRGSDGILPYMAINGDTPSLKGVALFDDLAMTGTLSLKESSMLMLMGGNLHDTASLTERVHDGKDMDTENYITIEVQKLDQSMEVKIDETTDQITVPVSVTLFANVIEYPMDDLDAQPKLDELSIELSGILTEKFQQVAEKIKEARSDVLGIGRRIHAYNYHYFQNIDWKEVYPDVDIQVDVEVEIIRHGILY